MSDFSSNNFSMSLFADIISSNGGHLMVLAKVENSLYFEPAFAHYVSVYA
jgi:hypothetical protein